MAGLSVGYYAIIVLSAVVGVLLLLIFPKVSKKGKKRDSLWLSLAGWGPLWLFPVALLTSLTHRLTYNPDGALGPVAWSDPWWPHMTVFRWLLMMFAVCFAAVTFLVKKEKAAAKFVLGVVALVLWVWFAMLASPILTRWMWILLLLGAACNLVFRGKKLLPLRKPTVKVIALLMWLFALLSADWTPPLPHYNTNMGLAVQHGPRTTGERVIDGISPLPLPSGTTGVQVEASAATSTTGQLALASSSSRTGSSSGSGSGQSATSSTAAGTTVATATTAAVAASTFGEVQQHAVQQAGASDQRNQARASQAATTTSAVGPTSSLAVSTATTGATPTEVAGGGDPNGSAASTSAGTSWSGGCSLSGNGTC